MEELIDKCLGQLDRNLISALKMHGKFKYFKAGEAVVKSHQAPRFLPIVIEGVVNVFSEDNYLKLHLYYVRPGESCIFSFANLFSHDPIDFSASAEVDSLLLLLPMRNSEEIFDTFPQFSKMILREYQRHYKQLLATTLSLSCSSLEERIQQFLNEKSKATGEVLLPLSHQQIAESLGTSREVVSRLLKKMSTEGKVSQVGRKIKLS